jgi:hypothetical protein
MAFKCGNCKGSHVLAAEGRACYAGNRYPCYWLIEVDTEDGPSVVECGAWAIETNRGFTCEAGHSHVNCEIRAREGWDYASDPFEARNLMKYGTFPMTMDGTGPAEIAR